MTKHGGAAVADSGTCTLTLGRLFASKMEIVMSTWPTRLAAVLLRNDKYAVFVWFK